MNPSYEAMERARREKLASLLQIGREQAVKRLGELHLCGDSHAMLSQIAYAINPYAGAWDEGACLHLRNVLAELIGGNREAASGAEHRCACGAGGCDRWHESEEVDGQSRTCPESDGDVSESDDGMSVTSELREWAKKFKYTWINAADGTIMYTTADVAPDIDSMKVSDYIIGIADRIDARVAEVDA